MSRKFGFTLVEMMVVVAVIMVMTGVGAVSLNQFNKNQDLDSKKEELITDLKLARTLAKTNQLPNETTGSLKYIKINLNNGIGIDTVAILADGTQVNYSSKENKSITANNSFGFSVDDGRLTDGNGNLVGTPLCLTLYFSNNGSNDKKYIYIESSGLVYEKANCN